MGVAARTPLTPQAARRSLDSLSLVLASFAASTGALPLSRSSQPTQVRGCSTAARSSPPYISSKCPPRPHTGSHSTQRYGQGRSQEANREHEVPGHHGALAPQQKHSRDARVRGGEREERPPDPRARQEEQPLGGKGQVRHNVRRQQQQQIHHSRDQLFC